MSRTAESPFSGRYRLSHSWRSCDFKFGNSSRRTAFKSPTSADVHLHVLVDLGAVDFDVNLLRVRRVRLQVAGNAVVKTHAESDQQIGFLNCRVQPGFAVHAHHSKAQRMRCREAAKTKQRKPHRDIGASRQMARTSVHRARKNDAVPSQNHRPLGTMDQLERLLVLLRRRRQDRAGSREVAA